MKKKRYRYIACGVCSISDPISDFRLLSGNIISDIDSDCIRVELPDDVILDKCKCDSYSTTKSNLKVGDLNPKAMYVRYGKWIVDENLTKIWIEGKIQPHNFYRYIENGEWYQDYCILHSIHR